MKPKPQAEKAPRVRSRHLSPLTDEGVCIARCGPPDHSSSWVWVGERNGISYVVSARWLTMMTAVPLGPGERKQLLLAARHFRRQGTTAVFVSPRDRSAFADRGLDPALGRVEPWFVGS